VAAGITQNSTAPVLFPDAGSTSTIVAFARPQDFTLTGGLTSPLSSRNNVPRCASLEFAFLLLSPLRESLSHFRTTRFPNVLTRANDWSAYSRTMPMQKFTEQRSATRLSLRLPYRRCHPLRSKSMRTCYSGATTGDQIILFRASHDFSTRSFRLGKANPEVGLTITKSAVNPQNDPQMQKPMDPQPNFCLEDRVSDHFPCRYPIRSRWLVPVVV